MPQYVGAVYLDVRFDPQKAAGDLTRQMSTTGNQAGVALGNGIADSLLAAGTKITRVGRQLTFGLSAPLLALGAKADQAFLGFDESMTKVAALTGVGIAQTNEWSQTVLDLGAKYGIAAEDAANALYLITSSGIKGDAAIATLDTTLKASAVGMGSAATVAGLLTSALNAYSTEGLTAAEAADTLTGAVQESKIPADQLAGSISELLPFGHQLHISFAQIVGSMAALSLQGTNAAQAATQLRGIFAALEDPSAQAAKGFDRIGLSAKDVRASLSSAGIPATMKLIRDAIVSHGLESDTELASMYGNVRALTGVYGLLADENGQITRVMDNTTNSAHKLDAAFAITADTAGFKAKQATAALNNELIALGEDVAPITTSLLGVARAGLAVFNALGPLRPVLVGIGASLAVLGPLAYSFGAIVDVVGLGAKAIEFARGANAAADFAAVAGADAVAGAEARVVAAEMAVVEATYAKGAAISETSAVGIAADEALVAAEVELAAATEAAAAAAATSTGAFALMGTVAAAALAPVAALVLGAAASMVIWNKRMEVAQADAEGLGDTFANKIAKGGIDDANKEIDKTTAAVADLSNEVANSHAPWDADYRAELGKGIDQLNEHITATRADIEVSKGLATQTGENADKIFQWLSNERNAGRVYATNKEALDAYKKAMQEHGAVVSTATTETGRLVDKAKDLASGFFGVQSATRSYEDAIDKVADSQRAAGDAERAVTDAHRAESDAIAKVTDAQGRQRDALDKVKTAQTALSEAKRTYDELLRGPTRDETLDVTSANLALKRAQQRARGKFDDPLDRQQAQLDVQRAQIALEEARGAHAKNLAKAQADVSTATRDVTSAQKEAQDAARAVVDAQAGVADAHRKVDDAARAAEKAQRDVTRAQEDAVGAADALSTKQAAFADTVSKSNEGLGPLTTYIGQLRDLYPQAAAGLNTYLTQLQGLQAFQDQQAIDEFRAQNPDFIGPVSGPLARQWLQAHPRAAGGPLAAGELATVNERGLPELWTQGGQQYLLPLQGGRVVPLSPAALPATSTAGSVTIGDVIVQGAAAPTATAYEVRRKLRSETRLGARR